MPLTRYFLVIVASLSLAACGDATLDTANVEDQIAPKLEQETGTKDVEVSCPDDVEAKKGDEFECDVTAPGGSKAKVKVVQQNDDGDVTWDLVQP